MGMERSPQDPELRTCKAPLSHMVSELSGVHSPSRAQKVCKGLSGFSHQCFSPLHATQHRLPQGVLLRSWRGLAPQETLQLVESRLRQANIT